MESNKSLADVKIPLGKTIVYALQHVFIMVAGAVVVPMLVGQSAGADIDIIFLISCALFVSGISTLIQSLGFKQLLGARIAVVEGTSFAALTAMQAIVNGKGAAGIQELSGAIIVAGVVCFLLAGVWGKLLKFFPHVVTGSVVTIIGISLFPTAIKWIGGGTNYLKLGSEYPGAAPLNILLAGVSLLIVLLCNKFLKGMLNNLSILFGIAGGTVFAAILDATGVSGANPLISLTRVQEAAVFGVPYPFRYGLPIFNLESILSIVIIMFVIMTEATGNMIAVHNMSQKKLDEKNLARGLRSSGLVTAISGCFNSYAVTPFGQNVGMLGLTGVYSRYVTACAGLILLVLGFFPKFGAVFAAIPQPVLGGVGFVMFGAVAVNGIRTLAKVEFNGNKNSIIVATSIGLSLIPSIIPDFFKGLGERANGILHSGMTIGCVAAIVLNLFFNVLWVSKEQKKVLAAEEEVAKEEETLDAVNEAIEEIEK